MNKLLCRTTAIIGWVSLVLFLLPSYQRNYFGVEDRWETKAAMGFPTSPWWEYTSTTLPGQGGETSFQLVVRSWSWLFLLLGVGCLVVRYIYLKERAPDKGTGRGREC